MVMMDAMSLRWGRTAVSNPVRPRVGSLQGSRGICRARAGSDAFGQVGGSLRNLVQHPVDPRLGGRRIRIIDDEGQLPGSGRRRRPLQGRGDVLTISRELRG